MINYAYGAQGLTEFRELRKQVAKEREEAVYRQIEMRENLMFSVGIFLCLGVISGIVILIFS